MKKLEFKQAINNLKEGIYNFIIIINQYITNCYNMKNKNFLFSLCKILLLSSQIRLLINREH